MVQSAILKRLAIVRSGRRLEYFTIAWNALEGLVAVIAGVVAGSISLVGFGIDSFIEVTSGSTLLWRMSVDADVLGRFRQSLQIIRRHRFLDPAWLEGFQVAGNSDRGRRAEAAMHFNQ